MAGVFSFLSTFNFLPEFSLGLLFDCLVLVGSSIDRNTAMSGVNAQAGPRRGGRPGYKASSQSCWPALSRLPFDDGLFDMRAGVEGAGREAAWFIAMCPAEHSSCDADGHAGETR